LQRWRGTMPPLPRSPAGKRAKSSTALHCSSSDTSDAAASLRVASSRPSLSNQLVWICVPGHCRSTASRALSERPSARPYHQQSFGAFEPSTTRLYHAPCSWNRFGPSPVSIARIPRHLARLGSLQSSFLPLGHALAIKCQSSLAWPRPQTSVPTVRTTQYR